jgi:hypothetical protein
MIHGVSGVLGVDGAVYIGGFGASYKGREKAAGARPAAQSHFAFNWRGYIFTETRP